MSAFRCYLPGVSGVLPPFLTRCTGACPSGCCCGAAHPKFQGRVPSLRHQLFAKDSCRCLQGAARSLTLALWAIDLTWRAQIIATLACTNTDASCFCLCLLTTEYDTRIRSSPHRSRPEYGTRLLTGTRSRSERHGCKDCEPLHCNGGASTRRASGSGRAAFAFHCLHNGWSTLFVYLT